MCAARSVRQARRTASCVSGLSTSPPSFWRRVSTSCLSHQRSFNFYKIFPDVVLCVEHEGPVSLVCVSSDGLSVLAATKTGNLGYLDVSSRGYRTLMRSHTDTVLGFSVDGTRSQITTASRDGTVRIWDMDSTQQVCFRPFIVQSCVKESHCVVKMMSFVRLSPYSCMTLYLTVITTPRPQSRSIPGCPSSHAVPALGPSECLTFPRPAY